MNEHELGTPAGVLEQYTLGAEGLPLPMASEAELDEQVEVFMRIWKTL